MAQGASVDERALVESAQRDPRRFTELYELHFGRVYGYIARRVRDRHHAEDLTSDVFRQALAGIRRFEWRGAPFSAWLFRIAANAIKDHWERSARDTGTPAPEVWEESAQEIERSAMLYQLVDGLPEDQRRVIVLRFVEQHSIREIAAELGRSEGAVKQLQLRALQNLRARMGGAHA
jgi:RNA polymerase sigma-70 factor (ECF subfamily)